MGPVVFENLGMRWWVLIKAVARLSEMKQRA